VTFEEVREATHPEDLPRTSAMAQRALDPMLRENIPYRFRIYRANDHALRWILAYAEAQFVDGDQRAARYIGTVQDITDQIVAEQALVESEARLRLALEVADMAVWEVNLDTLAVTGSPQLNLLAGFAADARPTFADFQSRYAPGEFDRVQKLGADAAARGESHVQTIIHQLWPDGTEKWLLLRAQVAPLVDGIGRRVIGVLIDVTEQQRSERRLELVAREMRHRVRNALTVVGVLARKTFGRQTDSAALERFSQRLAALSVATDMLGGEDDDRVILSELIEAVIAPHRDDERAQFSLSGPPATLGPRTASSLAMAIHELATNAVKYGALSVDQGSVAIDWAIAGGKLRLRWQELGGPAVEPGSGPGFGSFLLTKALFPVPNESRLAFNREGLRYELVVVEGFGE
jgi:PAS domain S-box-containing protein